MHEASARAQIERIAVIGAGLAGLALTLLSSSYRPMLEPI